MAGWTWSCSNTRTWSMALHRKHTNSFAEASVITLNKILSLVAQRCGTGLECKVAWFCWSYYRTTACLMMTTTTTTKKYSVFYKEFNMSLWTFTKVELAHLGIHWTPRNETDHIWCFRIAVSKLDVLDDFDEVKLGVAYRHNGKTLTSYPGECRWRHHQPNLR